MKHLGRKLLLPVAAVALAGGSFAFLASNVVPDSHAGEGAGNIAGYNVSHVHYTYEQPDSGTPNGGGFIQSVNFRLNHNATQVSAVVSNGYDFVYGHCYSTDGQSSSINNNGVTALVGPGSTVWTCYTKYNDSNTGGSPTSNTAAAPVGLNEKVETLTVTASQ